MSLLNIVSQAMVKLLSFGFLKVVRPAGGAFVFKFPARGSAQTALINTRAAALNQNAEHDDKKRASNNSDNRDTVHTDPPFFGSSNLSC
jgi:hypothetical protein